MRSTTLGEGWVKEEKTLISHMLIISWDENVYIAKYIYYFIESVTGISVFLS